MATGRENLIPLTERTKEEQRELQSKGGQASGAARRRKRDSRMLMQAMLKSVPALDKPTRDNLAKLGITGKGKKKDQYDLEMLSTAALLQKAMRGDVRAHRLMLEILGEDAATNRERERMEHERRMAELENSAPDLPDDGFIDALNGVDAFDGPEDVPIDLGDGDDDEPSGE